MNKFTPKRILLFLVGLAVCTLPVLIAALSYFPIWSERGDGSIISGLLLLIVILAATPIFKAIKMLFRSPAAYLMWLFAFAVFFSLERIAHEMTVISLVGFISNVCGAFIFRLCTRDTERKE